MSVDPQVAHNGSAAALQASPADCIVQLPCVHCGEITQCSSNTDPSSVFCCSGCEGAYQLIQGWGLTDFYALRDQMRLTGSAQPAVESQRYDHFDSPEFLGPSAPKLLTDGNCSAEFAVHGLHCAACAWLIENAAQHQPGLQSARVKMSDHTIRFIFDPQRIKLGTVAQFLDRLGYHLAPLDTTRAEHLAVENRRLLVQIAIAGFFAANAMWIAIALYAGGVSGVAVEHSYFLGLVGIALGASAVVGPGRAFFQGAFAALRTRTPHMDLPIALGLGVGTIIGLINAISGRGEIYFDSLATLVFLLLIGRWIQFRQQQRAARAVDLMLRITPRHAGLVATDGSVKLVLVDRINIGDRIRVMPGESIPVDGRIIEGSTDLDRSLLTGESVPVHVDMSDEVAAGTVNLISPIDVVVSALGRSTRIGRVMESIEAAASERTPIVLFADRIGGYFVLIVMALAMLTFAMWANHNVQLATAHATALLIVACPCALAMATPLAIAVGLGRAARAGILIRDGRALQQLAAPGAIWFDKTGTLTEGKHRVSSFYGDSNALELAAVLEQSCQHPVAAAVIREAKIRRPTPVETPAMADDVRRCDGGVVGRVSGSELVVGNRGLIESNGCEISGEMEAEYRGLLSRGESPVLIAVNNRVLAILGISDPIRPGAATVIQKLRDQGWKVGILSGDHPLIVSRVARAVGVSIQETFGGLSPEEKLAAVRESRSHQRSVVMVGDGANDAAALAAADVGIAVRGGAELSLQAAPVFVATGSLASLLNLAQGSKRITRIIFACLAISLAYNILAVTLAMVGWISPLVAAVLMPASSVSVIAVAFLSRSFVTTEYESLLIQEGN